MVIKAGRAFILSADSKDRQEEATRFDLTVRHTNLIKHQDACRLKPYEIVTVVDYIHAVSFSVTNADF